MAYTDQEILDNAKRMAAAGAAPDMVREYVTKAKAEQGGAATPVNQQVQERGPMLSREQLQEIGRSASASATPQGAIIDRYGETLKSAAIQGGPPAVGQAIGAPMAPYTFGAAPVVLGGLGGLGGYLADSYRTGNDPTWGGAIGATLAGATPGLPFAQGAKQIAQRAVTQGVINTGIAQIQKATDGGGALTGGEVAQQFVGGAASDLGMRAVGKAVGAGTKAMPKTTREVDDSLRLQHAKEIIKRGGAIPPREIGRGSELIGSIAEQASTYQAISRKNAPIFQQMIREELELPGQGPIKAAPPVGYKQGKNDIKDYIAKQYEPYETVRKYGFNPDELKAARLKQRAAFDRRQSDPEWRQEYDKQEQFIEGWENSVAKAAKDAGDDTLVERLATARGKIANAYAIDAAIGRSSGLLDPSVLGAMVENDIPLSGNARLIADFYNSFHKAAGDITRMPPPGSKGMTMNTSYIAAAEGSPSGILAALSRLSAGEQARRYITSDLAQNRFLAPRVDWNRGANAVANIPLYGGQALSRNVFLDREDRPSR